MRELVREWRDRAAMLQREADEVIASRGAYSLYSRKCAQAAAFRLCADQLEEKL